MKSRLSLLALLLTLMVPVSQAQAPDVSDKPLAVLVFAQWCYNCKQIVPRLGPLKAEFGDRVHFARLDVTNEEAKKGARATAKALGISKLYLANKGTGLVLLVDKNRKKVGELRYQQTDAEMREKLSRLADS